MANIVTVKLLSIAISFDFCIVFAEYICHKFLRKCVNVNLLRITKHTGV